MNDAVAIECFTAQPDDSMLKSLQSFYLIPTHLQAHHDVITQFEYHWGMNYGELSLKTPLNVLHLPGDIKDAMLHGGWTISPTITTLKAISKMQDYNSRTCKGGVKRRRLFTKEFPVGIYEYDFIPLKFTQPIFVRRLDPTGQPTYTRYDCPYAGLPRVKSCVHPFFVVHFSRRQIAFGLRDSVPMEVLLPTSLVCQMWGFRAPPEFSAPRNDGVDNVGHPHHDDDTLGSEEREPRGVKRPHCDDEEDESLETFSGSSARSDSIRTPKDPVFVHPETRKRPKLDSRSGVLYDTDSALRWIQGLGC